MLSPFLNLELMRSNQVGKEIIFNESIIQIEQLCSQMVVSFLDTPYRELKKGLYIISKEGDRYHNHLVYPIAEQWRYIKPRENMIFFIEERKSFFKFQQKDNSWVKIEQGSQEHGVDPISQSAPKLSKRLEYIGIQGKYIVPIEQDSMHLYINGNVNIEIKDLKSERITLLIKQNHQKKFKINWSGNVVFEKAALDLEINNLVVMNLSKTPEDDRYLANVLGIYI